MVNTSTRELERKAVELRLRILDTALSAGKGHVPPAFSCVEVLVALYYGGILRVNPKNPTMPDRDRFILSKGHACLALYTILGDLGFFPESELKNFAKDGSILAGHPDLLVPGVEAVTGALGHGLSIGAGMALSAKLDGRKWFVFCLLSDGECDEGSTWEATMFAAHHGLRNLVAVVDRNELSATDFTENVVRLEPFGRKWESFGWETAVVNGHSFDELIRVLADARRRPSDKPLAVIANTVKGKGVSFMERSPQWHHRLPRGSEVDIARQELLSQLAKLQETHG